MYGFSINALEMAQHIKRLLFEDNDWVSAADLQPKVAKYLKVAEVGIIWEYNDALNLLVEEDVLETYLDKETNTLYYRLEMEDGTRCLKL